MVVRLFAEPLAHDLPIKLLQLVPSYNPMLGLATAPVIDRSILVEVAVNRYHTSAAGLGILPDGVQPTNAE